MILVRKLVALAFLKPDDVIPAYENLVANDEYKSLNHLLDYLENNYIGRERLGQRITPRFPMAYWNQYERVLANLPRGITIKY